jgi:hypothetical protein
MLTSINVSRLDERPLDASLATAMTPAINTAVTMIATRNRLKKLC